MNLEEIKQVSLADSRSVLDYQRIRVIPGMLSQREEELKELHEYCKYPALLTQKHVENAKEFVIKLAEICYELRVVATKKQINQSRRLLNQGVKVLKYMVGQTNRPSKEKSFDRPTATPPGDPDLAKIGKK